MTIILVTPMLSERVRLPGIVGIILGGMLIGPYGFCLIEAGGRMEFLSTIELAYLMFSAGGQTGSGIAACSVDLIGDLCDDDTFFIQEQKTQPERSLHV